MFVLALDFETGNFDPGKVLKSSTFIYVTKSQLILYKEIFI